MFVITVMKLRIRLREVVTNLSLKSAGENFQVAHGY